ncbi:MAG: competence protein ComFB [Candidatus Omnitrophota bacterium]|nr:MAG: competence protein ComFB [Candidatus Omnitrophota bacterium]
MELKNYLEVVVGNAVERVLSDRNDLCKCEKCRMDITAIVLNRLPARYVVTNKGLIMTKMKEAEAQFYADILREVVIAIETVKNNQRH